METLALLVEVCSTIDYIRLDYTLTHYTTLHYTTFSKAPICICAMRFEIPQSRDHWDLVYSSTIDYITLHYTLTHYTTLHYTLQAWLLFTVQGTRHQEMVQTVHHPRRHHETSLGLGAYKTILPDIIYTNQHLIPFHLPSSYNSLFLKYQISL